MSLVEPSAYSDLKRLRSADGSGVYASGGELYSDAVFGRDSLEVAEDLLHLQPGLAREVITALARLQGTREAPAGPSSTEEEPGKIHHEHRSLFVGERRISPGSQHLLELLSARWGGDGKSFTYYGSADATPLFARLVTDYCGLYGSTILGESLVNKDGKTVTVQDSLTAALQWLIARIEQSNVGLVEFQRRNVPNGIPFQVWKDSSTSYLHRDGSIANYNAPIAAVEVQGYAYDALVGAGSRTLRNAAFGLREQLLREMWMPDLDCFAMGIDRTASGNPRFIDCIASNGALLLNTGVFDGMSDQERKRYVGGIVRRICSPEFVTDVGIRCRSLVDDGLVNFQDYHGTWAVWPKEGYDIAKGLARQGMPRLAQQLYARLLNGVNVAGEHVEFLYVSPEGKVDYDFRRKHVRAVEPTEIRGTNTPEAPQAWTVSAALAIKHGPQAAPKTAPKWARALEDELLSKLPKITAFRTTAECQAAFEKRGDFILKPPE